MNADLSDTRESLPMPDPTRLTTAQLDRAVLGLREILEVRLNCMEEDVERLANTRHEALASEREFILARLDSVQSVSLERFKAIEGTFASNALALTAALAAQKEAAAEQNKSNTLAIDKSEVATQKRIDANAELTTTSLKSLSDRLDDLKERADTGNGKTSGATSFRTEQRLNTSQMVAIVVAFMVSISTIASVLIAVHK